MGQVFDVIGYVCACVYIYGCVSVCLHCGTTHDGTFVCWLWFLVALVSVSCVVFYLFITSRPYVFYVSVSAALPGLI